MEERIIVFRDVNAKEEEICISTNAPREEIENALSYRNLVMEKGLLDYLCDFEIIQDYLEKRGYVFYDLNTREKYYW